MAGVVHADIVAAVRELPTMLPSHPDYSGRWV